MACLALLRSVKRYHHPPDPATTTVHPLCLSDKAVQADTRICSGFSWEQKVCDLLTDL